jgi:hypothetical protein
LASCGVSNRRQRVVVDDDLARRAPRGVVRLGEHGEHRLADVLDEAVGENRIVMDDRAAIVDAGNVRRDDHGDDAGGAAYGRQVHRADPRMRVAREAQGRVQRARQFGNIVGVRGATGDVQVRRFVRAGWPAALGIAAA